VAACLCGCGSSDSAAEGAAAQGNSAKARAASGPADMVAAVANNRDAFPADLHFRLASRPTVGKPLDIQFAIQPHQEIDRLFVRFQTADGLELVNGAETEHLERPAPQTAIAHTVTVLPQSDGIFYVTAVMLVDTPKESVARNFSIPIIAGTGVPDALGVPAAVAKP